MEQKKVIPAGSGWEEKDIREFTGQPAVRFGEQWTLITAGSAEDAKAGKGNWNTMTAAWGGLGVLWGKNVAFAFIRPQRHTFQFANQNPLFTLSFFDASRRRALEVAGGNSGRDTDKAAEAGITPIVFTGGPADGAIGFEEATEIILCRKLYIHDFDPASFTDPAVDHGVYPDKDYHRMYIAEILGLRVKK
jgi:flavin reductase (DIM6/NTAB) family NADH-FMN oxidoreductase RutF